MADDDLPVPDAVAVEFDSWLAVYAAAWEREVRAEITEASESNDDGNPLIRFGFVESEHPRDDEGQFSEKSGDNSGKASAGTKATSLPAGANPRQAMIAIATAIANKTKKSPAKIIEASHGLSVAQQAGTVDEWWAGIVQAALDSSLSETEIISAINGNR